MTSAVSMEIEPLPAAIEAERYVIGTLIVFPECGAEVFGRLHARDFLDRGHQQIFAALEAQYAAGDIDIRLAAAALKSSGEFSDGSAVGYMMELGGNVSTRAFLPIEIPKIIDAKRKRQLLEIAESAKLAALNGHTAEDVFGSLDADLWEFRRNRYGEPRYKGIEARDLATGTYDLRYLIDGLLVEGQPAFLGGPKKSLKTSLAMDLALSLATGGYFLGKFPVNFQRRVMFLSGESGLATLQETALRICRVMGCDLAAVDGFTLCTTLPRLHDASDLAECERFLAETESEVAIADPLYLMLTGDDAGNLFKQGALLRAWAEMCQSLNVTGILCHHTKSTVVDPYAPAELDHLAWSGCAEFARQWLLVSRREQYEPGSGTHRLWLTAGGSAGHSGLWAVDVNEGTVAAPEGRQWIVGVENATAARAAAAERKADQTEHRQREQLSIDRTTVCRVLAKYPDGLAQTAIRDNCGISGRRWPGVLAAMLQAGELVECEIKSGNQKTAKTGYRLNITEAA